MKRTVAIFVCLFMARLLAGADPQPRPNRLDVVKMGMTFEQVKAIFGPPDRVSRECLFRRHIEQWQYDDPSGWIEFNCVRGETAYVRAVYWDPNGR